MHVIKRQVDAYKIEAWCGRIIGPPETTMLANCALRSAEAGLAIACPDCLRAMLRALGLWAFPDVYNVTEVTPDAA